MVILLLLKIDRIPVWQTLEKNLVPPFFAGQAIAK
jgi:hypothetical protein